MYIITILAIITYTYVVFQLGVKWGVSKSVEAYLDENIEEFMAGMIGQLEEEGYTIIDKEEDDKYNQDKGE